MGTSNPFEIMFAITAIILLVLTVFAIVAPSIPGVDVPAAPAFPSFASNLDWTVSLTNWSGIGSFFVFIGGIFVYFASYVVYMVGAAGLLITILSWGFIPPTVSGAIVVLIGIMFVGSILMYIRGSGDGSSGK